MNEHNPFNTNLTEQRGATDSFLADRFRNSTEMFQPRPVSESVDDGMTMVMNPISQDDLRTDLLSGPAPAAITPLPRARGGLSTPKRAGLVGATLLAAALLVYIGRGYIHEPSEAVQPTELAAPADAATTDDPIAEIPLTDTTVASQPADPAPVAAPSAPAFVVLAPISDAVVPVTSASLPPIEPVVSESNTGSSSSTAAPTGATEPIAAQSPSDAVVEPVAALPAPATGSNEVQPTTDQVVTLPVAATDQVADQTTTDQATTNQVADQATTNQVADQTETTTASDQQATEVPTVADQPTSNTTTAETTEPSTAPVAQVEPSQPASQQQDHRGTNSRGADEGLKVAGQVLTKVAQPISNISQASRYFGQR